MSSRGSARSLWAACVQALPLKGTRVPAAGSPAFVALVRTLIKASNSLEVCNTCTPADQEAIVHKLKVPFHLGAALAKTTQCASSKCLDAVDFLLVMLLNRMYNHLQGLPPAGRVATWEQLQQSGLLDKLPALISAAAAGLDRSAETAGRAHLQGLASDELQPIPREAADRLLAVTGWIYKLQMQGDASGAQQASSKQFLCLDLAQIDLVLAVARDISRGIAQLGPTDSPDPEDVHILARAIAFMQTTTWSLFKLEYREDVSIGAQPAVKQVLLARSVAPCYAMALAAAAYRAAAEKQRRRIAQAAANSTSSSSSSSSSSTAGSRGSSSSSTSTEPHKEGFAAAVALAWQEANESQAQLPASHHQLFAALGVDVRLLLTLAAVETSYNQRLVHGPADFDGSDAILPVQRNLMSWWCYDAMGHLWEQKTAEQRSLQLQLQLLLPAVLLDCAARIPTSSALHGKYCLMAGLISFHSTACWSHLNNGRTPSSRRQHQKLPGAWVAEVIPAALQVARRVLPHLQEDADAAAAAEAGVQSSSSSSSTSSPKPSSAPEPQMYSTSMYRAESLTLLLLFVAVVCDTVLRPASQELAQAGSARAAGAAASTGSSSATEPPQGLGQGLAGSSKPAAGPQAEGVSAVTSSVVQILRVLEGLLRTASVARGMPAAGCGNMPFLDGALTELLEFALLPNTNGGHIPAMRCLLDDTLAARCVLQLCVAAGPGSAEQRALHGVLASVVKLCFAQHSGKVSGLLENPGQCLVVAAQAAAYVLESSSCAAAPATATALSPGAAGGTSSSAVSSSQAAAVQLLPSLVIIGRMCVLYGAQLPPAIPAVIEVLQITDNVSNMYGFQDRRAELAGLYKQAAPRHSVYDVLFNAALGQGTFGASTFYLLLQACLQWLTDSSVSAQLAGAGYGSLAAAAVQRLQSLAVSVGKLRYAPSTDPAPCTALAAQLQETGQCLSSFAVPRGCNNPDCINTSRTLEASLAGATTKCSGCRVASYCCKTCQKAQWKQHKPVCQALAAARAAK